MEHDYPPAFWWGGSSIQQGAVSSNRQIRLFSCKKRNATKNLTGDVLIVPLERKIAAEIVDLHAAALRRTPA